jgi:hypothetical protein
VGVRENWFFLSPRREFGCGFEEVGTRVKQAMRKISLVQFSILNCNKGIRKKIKG